MHMDVAAVSLEIKLSCSLPTLGIIAAVIIIQLCLVYVFTIMMDYLVLLLLTDYNHYLFPLRCSFLYFFYRNQVFCLFLTFLGYPSLLAFV